MASGNPHGGHDRSSCTRAIRSPAGAPFAGGTGRLRPGAAPHRLHHRQTFDPALAEAGFTVHVVMEINSREAVLRGFGVGVVSETELAPSPNIRALRASNSEMFTQACLVCLAERRDRPLIDAVFRTAASIDPRRRGSL